MILLCVDVMSFNIVDTKFKDAKIIESFYNNDERGSFNKVFENNVFNTNGINFNIKEVFMSISKKNVIRGLHFQYNYPQAKIVTVIKGACCDVIVDLRKKSETYLQYQKFSLNDINHNLLYIPKGFAHGFLSLTNDMHMLYFCDEVFNSKTDTGIKYNDSRISIDWPLDNFDNIIISERDNSLMTVDDYEKLNSDIAYM